MGDPETDTLPASTTSPDPVPVPELKREWQVGSYGTIPQSWNEHFWLTDWSYMSAAPSGTTRISSGLKMFDAQSGKKIQLEADGYPCGVPALRNGDTHFVLPISDEPPDSFGGKYEQSPVRHCTGLAVYDATTGHKTWGWTVGTSSPIHTLAIKGTAVQVRYDTGEEGCFRLTDGSPLSVSLAEDCAQGDSRPALTDGEIAPPGSRSGDEIARLDGVALAAELESGGSTVVRARDLGTGQTLWVDELDPDPSDFPSWPRTETYAATPDSLLRIRYEFEEGDEFGQFPPTFAFISRVDPRTGEELSHVGKVHQGLFVAQIGDITVMGVDQEEGFDSHLAGFRIPSVG
ncbi:hypothetical protein [Nocardioides sp.]|uniref:hypothetical protein n=1 Tax=Nocardioides sp. TaxID=35761 RepID=UPI002D015E94|nr:hypothetical protein [Nocardioides sp.]HXH77366.1 hypothetical protein [Nocardioides sp.]